MEMLAGQYTPLWLASHLPLKGGDWPASMTALILGMLTIGGNGNDSVISPLEGEMAGKPEGGMPRDSIKT
ncbi:hypothetical protein C7477_11331 [Phyllobacterium leguminum]|uniref:Uncharacterized protein n=1 Tax=Phyllobacterium leguminum TaxID=314237 RepID=A0A318T3L9_9HYPH|nr:hypothetical protein C7477_11331 [Phyllobacterium leguminum]